MKSIFYPNHKYLFIKTNNIKDVPVSLSKKYLNKVRISHKLVSINKFEESFKFIYLKYVSIWLLIKQTFKESFNMGMFKINKSIYSRSNIKLQKNYVDIRIFEIILLTKMYLNMFLINDILNDSDF